MIYYYTIKIRFIKGDTPFIKLYHKSFLEVGQLFYYLENCHKNNYTLISIKEVRNWR